MGKTVTCLYKHVMERHTEGGDPEASRVDPR